MPAATFFIASLAALEAPHPAPSAMYFQTTWSLSASTRALAAAQERPIVGPGQATQPVPTPVTPARPEKQGEVTVMPTPDAEADDFEALEDPAAPVTPDAVSPEAMPSEAVGPDAAVDPIEDELAQSIKPTNDPFEPINRFSFAVSQEIDKIVIRPLALTYTKIAPKPMRDGLRNVLAHWGAPIILANDLLQLKPKRAIKTLGRFLINTLLGLGGLFDVAKEKKFNLPHHGNRFSNTLAMYGIKPGPYFYIPVLGPTTLLDQVDRVQDFVPGIDYPLFRGGRGSAFQYTLGLEDRATNDTELKALLDDAVDPYATFRETWLQERKGEVERLKAPDGVDPNTYQANPLDSLLDDPLVDPAGGDTSEPAAPESDPVVAEPATPVP